MNVHDVVVAGRPAQRTHGPCVRFIERHHSQVRRVQDARQTRLTSATTPGLGQNPGDDPDLAPGSFRFGEEHMHPTITTFDRKEGTGVEDHTPGVHEPSRPRTSRAHERSSWVGWPNSAK